MEAFQKIWWYGYRHPILTKHLSSTTNTQARSIPTSHSVANASHTNKTTNAKIVARAGIHVSKTSVTNTTRREGEPCSPSLHANYHHQSRRAYKNWQKAASSQAQARPRTRPQGRKPAPTPRRSGKALKSNDRPLVGGGGSDSTPTNPHILDTFCRHS